MLHSLETLARDAKSWPFEQARNLLAHVLKKRLSDAERNAAKLLFDAGKADEALATFEALQKLWPVGPAAYGYFRRGGAHDHGAQRLPRPDW
jgi:hypothetical protein